MSFMFGMKNEAPSSLVFSEPSLIYKYQPQKVKVNLDIKGLKNDPIQRH